MTTFPAKVPGIGKRVTDFAAKIYACGAAHLHKPSHVSDSDWEWRIGFAEKIPPKKHTIREDAKGRWKEGNRIHFCQGGYKPGRIFAEGGCTGIQAIAINPYEWVKVDGRSLQYPEIERLAINDGFSNASDFFAYFAASLVDHRENFEGKIIHWTDTRY